MLVAFSYLFDDLGFATDFAVDGRALFEQIGAYATKGTRLGLQAVNDGIEERLYKLTNRLLRRVTGRRTTPGVAGAAIPPSSPLSLPDEMCKSLANMLTLSRLEPAVRITVSRAKYPPLSPS